MAEYRPYRVINAGAQARLTQVKLAAMSGFILLALLINWRVTELAARLFGYSRALGPSMFGLYAPWEWMVWWSRWHWVEHFQPVWELCIREAAYALLALGVLARQIARVSDPSAFAAVAPKRRLDHAAASIKARR